MANPKNDKYEEIENADLQTPGVDDADEMELDDDDLELEDGMEMDEPETVGSRHEPLDEESGKGDASRDERIPQDSDPSE